MNKLEPDYQNDYLLRARDLIDIARQELRNEWQNRKLYDPQALQVMERQLMRISGNITAHLTGETT